MAKRLFVILGFLLRLISRPDVNYAYLVVKPTNVTYYYVLGQEIKFTCGTNDTRPSKYGPRVSPVQWSYKKCDGDNYNSLTHGGSLDDIYNGRLKQSAIRNGSITYYTLVIPHATAEDAGFYQCKDLAGYDTADEAQFQLILAGPGAATCEQRGEESYCECNPGYTGPLCYVDIKECASNPCSTNATCEDRIDYYECNCPPGYTDTHCESQINLPTTTVSEKSPTTNPMYMSLTILRPIGLSLLIVLPLVLIIGLGWYYLRKRRGRKDKERHEGNQLIDRNNVERDANGPIDSCSVDIENEHTSLIGKLPTEMTQANYSDYSSHSLPASLSASRSVVSQPSVAASVMTNDKGLEEVDESQALNDNISLIDAANQETTATITGTVNTSVEAYLPTDVSSANCTGLSIPERSQPVNAIIGPVSNLAVRIGTNNDTVDELDIDGNTTSMKEDEQQEYIRLNPLQTLTVPKVATEVDNKICNVYDKPSVHCKMPYQNSQSTQIQAPVASTEVTKTRVNNVSKEHYEYGKKIIYARVPLVNGMPVEVLEIILQKASFYRFVMLWKMTSSPAAEVYEMLTCVCDAWLQTIIRRKWFATELRRQLNTFCATYNRRPKRLAKLQTDLRNAIAVAQLNNNLYILCSNSNAIIVYKNETPYRRLNNLVLKDMKEPIDITSCRISRSLYAADTQTRCVWRVNVSTTNADFFTFDQWLRDITVVSLSMNLNSDIVVTGLAAGNDCMLTRVGIYVFSIRGELKYVIPLEEYGIMEATHSFHTLDDKWLIINDWKAQSSSRSVSEERRSGRMIHKPSVQTLPVDSFHAVIDEQNEHIFISDMNSKRVVIMQKNPLRVQRILLDSKNMNHTPGRLCFIKEKMQLLVMDGAESGMYLYDLSA